MSAELRQTLHTLGSCNPDEYPYHIAVALAKIADAMQRLADVMEEVHK